MGTRGSSPCGTTIVPQGLFPLGYNSPVLQLITGLHDVPRMGGAMPLFPPYTLMTWTVTTVPFIVRVSSVVLIFQTTVSTE
jgi:hypothetical protein